MENFPPDFVPCPGTGGAVRDYRDTLADRPEPHAPMAWGTCPHCSVRLVVALGGSPTPPHWERLTHEEQMRRRPVPVLVRNGKPWRHNIGTVIEYADRESALVMLTFDGELWQVAVKDKPMRGLPSGEVRALLFGELSRFYTRSEHRAREVFKKAELIP